MKLLPLAGLALVSLVHAAFAAAPGVRIVKDVAYLGAERTEKLDLYLPEAPAAGKRSPALVWIHGGGWAGGEKGEQRALEICGTLAAAGYVAISIDYRLGQGSWPQNLLDCKNAVRFLRAKADAYHLDPQRIAVAGGSAGGHLALMVGFTTGMAGLEPAAPYPGVSSAVRCIIDMYGPTDLLTRKDIAKDGTPSATRRLMGKSLEYFGAKDDADPVLKLASPVTHVRRDVPPVLVLHGRADTTVDYHQSDELVRILKEKGATHEYLLIDGVGHTFAWEKWGKKTMERDLRPVALAFLAQHLGP
jgi:acetyl esterase/lipase